MKKVINQVNYIYPAFVVFLLTLSCEPNEKHKPLSVICGEVSLEQAMQIDNMDNPAIYEGIVTDENDTPIDSVLLEATSFSETQVYRTYTKENGSYILYVEGSAFWDVTVEKTGYITKEVDLGSISFGEISKGNDIVLEKDDSNDHQPPPDEEIPNLLITTTKYDVSINPEDITFNGTNILILTRPYLYKYDLNINPINGSVMIGYDYINMEYNSGYLWCNGGWVNQEKKIYKVDPESFDVIEEITCNVPLIEFEDYIFQNNSIWLVAETYLYKLSMTGELLATYDYYALNKESDGYCYLECLLYYNNNIYLIYKDNKESDLILKIDMSNGNLLAKGELHKDLSDIQGITYDGTSIWVATQEELYKLTITQE